MTSMQLEYHKYKEGARHNQATESQAKNELMETARHNLAFETETRRHNVVGEMETQRHNIVGERETNRHNVAAEMNDYIKAAAARSQAETSRRVGDATIGKLQSEVDLNRTKREAEMAGVRNKNADTQLKMAKTRTEEQNARSSAVTANIAEANEGWRRNKERAETWSAGVRAGTDTYHAIKEPVRDVISAASKIKGGSMYYGRLY